MNPERLMSQACILVNAGTSGENAAGDIVRTDERTPSPCLVQAASSNEREGGTVVEEGLVLFVPTGKPLRSGTRVELELETFEVDGEPIAHWSPRERRYTHQSGRLIRASAPS